MKAETINKLVNQAITEGEDAGQIVTDFVKQEEEIKRIISRIESRKKQITEEYDNKICQFNQEIVDTQKRCPHIETTYYPDASGGNDSETICDWCEKKL